MTFQQTGNYCTLSYIRQNQGYNATINIATELMTAQSRYESRLGRGYMLFRTEDDDIIVSINGAYPTLENIYTHWIVMLGDILRRTLMNEQLLLSGNALDDIVAVLPESVSVRDRPVSKEERMRIVSLQ